MGEEAAAVVRYEPGRAFEEVKQEEAMLDVSQADSKEFWLVQWVKDKNSDVSGFHGKELSLKLHKDGSLGSLDSSSGQSYDLVSYAYQQPNATVFLPSRSETKAVGKIARRVCLVPSRNNARKALAKQKKKDPTCSQGAKKKTKKEDTLKEKANSLT